MTAELQGNQGEGKEGEICGISVFAPCVSSPLKLSERVIASPLAYPCLACPVSAIPPSAQP